MKTLLHYYLFLGALLISQNLFAQTQFWSDTFEDTGAPSAGTRTPSIEFGNSSTGIAPWSRYFMRTNGSDISLNLRNDFITPYPYSNLQGSKYWAGEDLDGNIANQSPAQTITWSNINISGRTGLSFRGLIAAWNGDPTSNANSIWEGLGFSGAGGADFIEVEYSIDGGNFTKLIGIYCHTTGNTSGILKLDTNGDLVGDGTTLDRNFQEFTANIAGTGSSLTLRFKASSGSLVEEFAIDNFRLFSSCTQVATATETMTWNGSVSTDWTNPCNWTPNGVPTATNDVTIPASGITNAPNVLLGNAVAKSINTTNNLTVSANATLTVTNNVTGEFGSNQGINIAGTLQVNGTASSLRGVFSGATPAVCIIQSCGKLIIPNGSYESGTPLTNNGYMEIRTVRRISLI
jgi:hypothetical protein